MDERSYNRALIDSLREPIIVVDRRYRIYDANDAFCREHGKKRGQLIGRCCHEITHGLDRRCDETGVLCPVRRVFETGEHTCVSHVHRLPGGGELLEEICASPLHGDDGKVLFAVEGFKPLAGPRERRGALRRGQAGEETITGIVSICAACKKIRNDNNEWEGVEHYISSRSEAVFSHAICPSCARNLYPELF